jgi:hypothetical protein
VLRGSGLVERPVEDLAIGELPHVAECAITFRARPVAAAGCRSGSSFGARPLRRARRAQLRRGDLGDRTTRVVGPASTSRWIEPSGRALAEEAAQAEERLIGVIVESGSVIARRLEEVSVWQANREIT